MTCVMRIDIIMVRAVRKIVQTEYYYATESESESESDSESDATTVIFDDEDWKVEESDDEESGSDYESESDEEEFDDPKPYFGEGFRVYFDSHADKKFFMKAFGFQDA